MRKSAPLFCALLLSLSARRAWIEIPAKIKTQCKCHVALRKESVDRNARSCARFSRCLKSLSARRAWIEIAVSAVLQLIPLSSLSARRAWIEISSACQKNVGRLVALRKESVDRNFCVVSLNYKEVLSLSARRAWIEIVRGVSLLRKITSRSPQGERG